VVEPQMMPLLVLQITRGIAARSWQKCIPPKSSSFFSTTASSAYSISTPQYRRPLFHNYAPARSWQQVAAGLHPQYAAANTNAFCRASSSSGVISKIPNPGKMCMAVSHCNILGSGQSWVLPYANYAKRGLSWLRPTRRAASWGGFQRSSIRHFGQGLPLAFVIVMPFAMDYL
jgi:hypothetical protein